jgi:hypothetical protein
VLIIVYIISSSSYCCSVVYFADSIRNRKKKKFRAQIRRNQSKAEKSNSTIPIRSEFITHSDRIRGKNPEEFNVYSARTQIPFGLNKRKSENA